MSARLLSKWFALLLLCAAGQGNAATLTGTAVAWGATGFGETNVPASASNVIAVAAGYHFSLALRADGTVVGWGASWSGQTTPPPSATNLVAIAAGYNHALALRNDGTVVAWGDNSSGQLNIPSYVIGIKAIAAGHYHNLALGSNGVVYAWGGGSAAVVPNNIYYAVTAIAAGGSHSLALLTTGQVIGWGDNTYNQIDVSDLYSITGLGAGDNFSLFIQYGAVVMRGKNDTGMLTPPSLSGVTAVSGGGSHCAAVTSDMMPVVWGDNTSGQLNMPSNILATAISAGSTHTIALKVEPASIVAQPQSTTVSVGGSATLSVVARGSQPLYYLWYKDGTALTSARSATLTISPAQLADAGNYYVYIWNPLNSDGKHWVTSQVARVTVMMTPTITTPPQNAVVPVGSIASFSVTAAGTPPLYYQWRFNGANISGANSSNLFLGNVQLTASGNYCVVVANNYGAITSQVASLTVKPIPVILNQPRSQTVLAGSSVTLSVDATNADFYQWRKAAIDNNSWIDLPGANGSTYSMSSVQGSNAGWYCVAISNAYGGVISSNVSLSVISLPGGTNALLVAWGERWIWNGSSYADLTPPGGLEAVKIANGLCHSLGLSRGGLVVGWGDNNFGQAGPPTSLDAVVDIAAGNYHSLARRSDGTVVAWGKNDFGQINVPPGLSGVAAIAAGGNHSLALKSDGTILGWGNSTNGQTLPSPTVGNANFMAIAAGENHSLGVRSNYTVGAWGANNLNQTRVPTGLNGVKAVAAGDNHSLALRTNGTVIAWGDNTYGQTNVPRGLSNVIAIACGANHCIALKRGGVTVSWGQNNWGQTDTPQQLGGVLAVSARGDHSLALKTTTLRLTEAHRLPSGATRLLLRNEDGSAITQDTFNKTQIVTSTNFMLNVTNWVPLTTNIWLINGGIQVEDPNTNLARRYYMSIQTP